MFCFHKLQICGHVTAGEQKFVEWMNTWSKYSVRCEFHLFNSWLNRVNAIYKISENKDNTSYTNKHTKQHSTKNKLGLLLQSNPKSTK